MKNQELVKALVDEGLISQQDGNSVLKESEALRKNAEDIIYSRNLVQEAELARVKSKLLKIPYKKIDPESVSEEVFRLISWESIKTYQMVPLSRAKDLLVVGMVYPDNTSAQEALRFLAKKEKINLGVYIVTPSDINALAQKFSRFSGEIESALLSLNSKTDEGGFSQKVRKLEDGLSLGTTEAPIIRIVASLLKEAVGAEASDIHVEPQRSKTRIRFRIDGNLQEMKPLPAELSQAIISRIKVLADLKLDESRMPQDGRFRTVIFEKEIDFRVATFPTPNGEKAALRVLDPAVGLKNLEAIGITGKNYDLLTEGINKPFGLVLLTGPTGSGKTTTLYALVRILNKDAVNILSLEDPVEYTIDGVNQSQVRPEIGYDFASGLRQILRQDPDVIMVGEIRDEETAGLAVQASLTGHIVLSTLHTNDAVGVIPRLIDMGVSSYLLPSALNLMAAQRLVSRLCDKCRKAEEAPPGIEDVIKKELSKLPANIASKYRTPFKIFHAQGCAACNHKGVSGRIAIFEVFRITKELAEVITSASFNESMILEEAKRQGMTTMRQDGVLKALDGMVGIEEVLRETQEI